MSSVYCRKILFLLQILILLQKILLHITKKKKIPKPNVEVLILNSRQAI